MKYKIILFSHNVENALIVVIVQINRIIVFIVMITWHLKRIIV